MIQCAGSPRKYPGPFVVKPFENAWEVLEDLNNGYYKKLSPRRRYVHRPNAHGLAAKLNKQWKEGKDLER